MTVRVMTIEKLHMVLGWAADEGWDPGLDDARPFYAADPKGFFIKEVSGEPVAAISVVNHDPDFAFLGLYLCKPDFRGRGHGMEVWRAGMLHAGSRCIGLDGVPDQQENYARSGFTECGSTVRYEGRLSTKPNPHIRPARPSDLAYLCARDAMATGIQRDAFASAWFSPDSTRQTVLLTDGAKIQGFATFRRCISGVKIGPLQASSKTDAHILLVSNPFEASAGTVLVDVQQDNAALAEMLSEHGFEPVFKTARMFTGNPPERKSTQFQAIATMELG